MNPYLFPNTSRYFGLEVARYTDPSGKRHAYLRRRFVPQANSFGLLYEHPVSQGERLDHLAARYLGDSEQFWLLCDANNAMNPFELLVVGQTLRVPALQHGLVSPQNGVSL